MKKIKPAIRKEIDRIRHNAGLENYTTALTAGKCEKCNRVYYWRTLPDKCPWPGCDGKVKRAE